MRSDKRRSANPDGGTRSRLMPSRRRRRRGLARKTRRLFYAGSFFSPRVLARPRLPPEQADGEGDADGGGQDEGEQVTPEVREGGTVDHDLPQPIRQVREWQGLGHVLQPHG